MSGEPPSDWERFMRWRSWQLSEPERPMWCPPDTQQRHDELAAGVVARNPPPEGFPGWADPVILFQCVCGKLHLRMSGERCPCGAEFVYPHRQEYYR